MAIGLPLLTLMANFAIGSRLRAETEHQTSSRNLFRVSAAFVAVCGVLYVGVVAVPEIFLMMGAVSIIALIGFFVWFAVLAVPLQLLLKGVEKGRTLFAVGLWVLTTLVWIIWWQ